MEAVGGKRNPNITPIMILQFNSKKWDNLIASEKTIGEVLYKNDTKLKNSIDLEFNKKNRVIAAQFASQEAIANTPHSPQFNTTIPQSPHGVNTHSMQNSENDTKMTPKRGKPRQQQQMSMIRCSLRGEMMYLINPLLKITQKKSTMILDG